MKNKFLMGLVTFVLVTMFSFMGQAAFALDANLLTDDVDKIGEAIGEDAGAGDALPARIGELIKVVLSVLGVVLVLIIVYAGFLWMTAGGDEGQVKKALSWIKNAVIGLVIILSAYAITDYVIGKLMDSFQ